MKKIISFILFLAVHTSLSGVYPVHSPSKDISEESWQAVYPYLLPDDFVIKGKLDEIFSHGRVTLNSSSLLKAGFTTSKTRSFSRIVVTKHPDIPGYVFKIYLDDEDYKPKDVAQRYFLKRIKGALAIQKIIDENNLQDLFKVPKKWIYVLPDAVKAKKKYSYKSFILVAEDMHLLSADENKKAWKSSQVDKNTLVGLYLILKDAGLLDCTHIDNIPFSKDGKITFIDTEVSGVEKERVPFKRLKKSLSTKMRHFWYDLIGEH